MLHSTQRSLGVSLREEFPEGYFFGTDDIQVRSCSARAAECQPGDLYVALVEDDRDGHQDIDLAVQRGATAVLAERPIATSVPTCVVEDSREALGFLCHALAGNPSEQMRLVGVTGSHGKTVTSVLMRSILDQAGPATGWSNSISWSDSTAESANDVESPLAPVLCNRLTRMLRAGCTHAVVEVNSRALAQRNLTATQLDAVIVTNLEQGDLELHGTAANFQRASSRIFEHLKPHGFAALNLDDSVCRDIGGMLDRPLITYAIHEQAEVTAHVLERHASEQLFLLTAGSETIPVRTSLIGDAHIYNCLAAAAAALVMGIDLPTIVRGLERVQSVPGRLERIECGQGFGVYVDSGRTPARLATALRTVRQVTRGRVICVMGAEGDCRQNMRPLLGRVLDRGSDLPVLTSDNPGSEPPLQIIHDMLDGFRKCDKAWIRPDREAAIRWALETARPGDAVLIAGKGERDYQSLDQQLSPFDDRQVARDILFAAGAEATPPEPIILPFSRRRGPRRAG